VPYIGLLLESVSRPRLTPPTDRIFYKTVGYATAVQRQPYYGELPNYRGGRHEAHQDALKVLTKQRCGQRARGQSGGITSLIHGLGEGRRVELLHRSFTDRARAVGWKNYIAHSRIGRGQTEAGVQVLFVPSRKALKHSAHDILLCQDLPKDRLTIILITKVKKATAVCWRRRGQG
jgi:hypothetical protein